MFRWPECFQLKPSTETQLCALMCRQLHTTDRGVTHVIVQRYLTTCLPPGPFFFALVTSVECAQAALLYALPLQPQKRSLSSCASHVCAKGLAGWPRTICSGHICKLQNRLTVDAVQRQACSPPPSQSSCASPPGRGGKAWEGARPTSRVPVRNEGTGTRVLSNLNCVAFPAAQCLMAISA